MTRREAVDRHLRCLHARACRRAISLPTMAVVTIDNGDVISEVLLCDCCPTYLPREEGHGERMGL